MIAANAVTAVCHSGIGGGDQVTKLRCLNRGFRSTFNISGSDFFTGTGFDAPAFLTYHLTQALSPTGSESRITVSLESTGSTT